MNPLEENSSSTQFDARKDGTNHPSQTTLPLAEGHKSSEMLQRPTLPNYEIMHLLGRGGMGVVWLARHQNLDRLVALKMISAPTEPADVAMARFHTEAQSIAHLHHPHFVQIYDIGEFEGRPFLALEYVEGGSLSRKLRQMSYSPRQAAQLTEMLARAIHHAHEQGIIHRDLKPGNILLTTEGIPKITDFGLAKRLHHLSAEAGAPLTQTGEILGTPSYMAPEQAAGERSEIGPATDIYALGAILYELLTSRPPFEGDSTMQVLLDVLHKDPVPPQKLQPKIPRDLQTICLTCLHKDTSRRYPSAEALANDLRSFLAGEPIQARPTGRWERVRRWMQRQPAAATLLGVALTALAGLLIGLWLYSALAVSSAAVMGLLFAGWWYSARLKRALRRIDEQYLETERNIERLHLLLETTQRLMRADNLDELLRLLSEATTRMVNAERATIYLIDEPARELWSKVALGDDVGMIRIPLGSGIAGTVALTGETIHLSDPYADPRFNQDIDRRTGYRTRNLITFAMKSGEGRILGVFQVLNKRQGTFGRDDIELLQALAASAAIIVEKGQKRA